MRATHLSLHRHRAARRPDWPGPPRLTSFWARMRSYALDRQLARGVLSWCSPLHAARSLQLTSDHRRELLADSLEHLLAEARRPARRGRLRPAVIPERAGVQAAAPWIEELAERLRGSEPVRAEGVARLVELLSDGAGPFYCSCRTRILASELDTIARWLDVQE